MSVACQNCKQRPGKTVSFDLDLPAVTLCEICRLAVQMGDLEMFDELHATGQVKVGKKTRRARAKGALR